MKSWKPTVLLTLCLCLSACGTPAEEPVTDDPAPGGTPVQTLDEAPKGGMFSLDPDEEATVTTYRIVDGAEDGNLLLAKLCRCVGADVCRLSVDGVPVTLDGETADASVLEDGMTVEVSFNGQALETFPAQLGQVYSIAAWSRGQEKNPMGTTYDLCGLYLQVLDDLWQKDSGLNEGIGIAGLDLSGAPGDLTESEKSAIAWRFGEMHGVEVVTGTFEELEAQGYFTATAISTPAPEEGGDYGHMWVAWEDGCLFSITVNEDHKDEIYSMPVLFFNAEKWRTPLGAYCFYDCSALWAEGGAWTGYNIGGEMLS